MTEAEYTQVPIKENGSHDIQDKGPTKYGLGVRHVQSFIFFMCLTTGYIARAHLAVTVVAMTALGGNRSSAAEPNTLLNSTTPTLKATNLTATEPPVASTNWDLHRTYDWPKSTQEMVLSSFFLGYCIMMFPFGVVCQRWGGKIPLQIAMFVNAVVSFVSPWLVLWGGWKALCACRVLQGLSQAGVYPAILTLLTNWVPASERGSLSSYVYTGSGVGAVIGFQMGGILGFSRFGWASTFWMTGIACFIGFALITFFGVAKPSEHKSIAEAEKQFIIGSMSEVQTKAKVPWKAILTSVPAWATFIAHTGNAVCFVFFFMQVPTYLSAVLKLNIQDSGVLSSLPHIATFLSSMACGSLSDFCTNRRIVTFKNARKISNSIAAAVPSLVLFAVSYTSHTALAVFCFVLAMTAHAAMHTGWMINYVDLSPNYSGALLAFGNTVTNAMVLVLPVMVSYCVTDVTNQHQWRITMFLMGSFTIASNIVFLVFMSVDIQPWNDVDKRVEANGKATEEFLLSNKLPVLGVSAPPLVQKEEDIMT